MGRKSRYQERVKDAFPLIFKYLVDGLTEVEICIKLGVAQSTFTKYKKENEELRELLKEGKQRPNAKVEQALYKSALGIEYEEQKITTDEHGKIKVERTKKQRAPSEVAMIFWLKNRDPDRWKDRRDPFAVSIDDRMANTSDEDLQKEIEKLQKGK